LVFEADKAEYLVGEKAQLSWASTNTRFCNASGDWEGKLKTDGVFRTPPLDGPKTFYLKCAAKGGGIVSTVAVAVAAPVPDEPPDLPPEEPDLPPEEPEPDLPPAPAPTIAFSAADSEVAGGAGTVLSWSTTDALSCEAGDGWAGTFGPDGSSGTGAINSTTSFSMSCNGAGGSASASVQVVVVPAPTIAFSAADSEIAGGASTVLSWSTTDALSCEAGDGWAGTFGPDGSSGTGAINSTTSFSMSCSGTGGRVNTSVQVVVVPPPTVTFAASDSEVNSGGSTTLTWSATNAGSCQADGGWTGGREPAGSELVGPIDGGTTFSLTCTGTGGNAMQMVSVSAAGDLRISWVSPDENVDGTELTDLARYRIYYGPESRNYSNSVDVTDPAATNHTFRASSGEHFVTMTALDMDGNESSFSNEIVRSVP